MSNLIAMLKNAVCVFGLMGLFAGANLYAQTSPNANYYQAPKWQPRGVLPYADAISNTFWPKSPEVAVDYNDPFFDESRLSVVPPTGVYPRVLITPSDVEKVRSKVALGDNAPAAFKVMWERVAKQRTPFFALVTQNDTLGRALAVQLVQQITNLQPKLDELDKRPERDNLWAVERSIVALGHPDPPSEIWDLLNYDYLHKWMTPSERELARATIARICYKRISNFLAYPDHFMINNHQGFGMEYIRLMLLIEGQQGFDKALFQAAAHKVRAMIDWYLDKDGMCYESIKGWLNISAFVAVGLRERDLLKHSHLRAKMHFFQAAIRWEDGSWKIRDEMRASAFHVIWMMHYLHPTQADIDFLYQSTFPSHSFLTDASAKWPDPVGICTELLLLYADAGMQDKQGKAIDWNNQANIDALRLPALWQDSARGYVDVRNSWRKDDLHVGFVCKQDFFYGGHEGSENNRLTLWKDGVNWIQDNNMLATKATFLQNMLTIDGKGLHWPPAPGNWLGVKAAPNGVVASGDGKIGYSYFKVMQVHPLAFPSAKIPYYAPFAEGNFDLTRDLQIAFQPSTIQWNHGYAHTDYGPWSGETRLVESYKPWNVVQKAYRTVHVAKGNYPYMLVFDDVQKDSALHDYSWNISVPVDAELVDAATPEVVFQNTEPAANRINDLIIAKGYVPKDPKTGKALLKKGDPLCLIRVLWRNTEYGFPVPRLEKFQAYSLITIPAKAVEPAFKILVYPFKYGEPLPQTTWNVDKTQLSVTFNNQQDVYHLYEGDGGRTVLAAERNKQTVVTSGAPPARPNVLVQGAIYNQNDFRYTQAANKVPEYVFADSLLVQFVRVNAPAQIRFTLDGSEPTENAALYSKPLILKKSATVKAKVFYAGWKAGATASETTTATFVQKIAAAPLTESMVGNQSGLLFRTFEMSTHLYNDKGFFDAYKIMLPNFTNAKATYSAITKNFQLPIVSPVLPLEAQSKGFYDFSGYFYAATKGVYTFDVYSCGPVVLELAQQTAIEAKGVFHQQLTHRTGEAVLDKGWHKIHLIVCDPLFWNSNSLDVMPLTVQYRINEGAFQPIGAAMLRYPASETQKLQPVENKLLTLSPLSAVPMLERGLTLQVYDRTGLRRDARFLDIDSLQPMYSVRTAMMEDAISRNSIKAYEGYFYAPMSGVYTFLLPKRNGDNALLGGLQATCQNQLVINQSVVMQRGVYGRNLSGKVILQEGWYPISLRFGNGEASCKVVLPDNQQLNLGGNNLFRPSLVSILPNGKPWEKNLYEIYQPTTVQLLFEKDKDATIRYTLDGSVPTADAPVYNKTLTIEQSCKLTVAAFKNNELLTKAAQMVFKLVKVPQEALLGNINFDNWDGKSLLYPVNAQFKVWIAPLSKPVLLQKGKAIEAQSVDNAMPIVDVNVAKGGGAKPGFRLYDIPMKENALSVAVWFKTNEKNGKLFGKEGYNAFGKSYKTFSCAVNNGKLVANPGKISGGAIVPDEWQYVVLTANENQMDLYLNGEKVASGLGTKDLITDAFDFFTGHHAIVKGVQMFNKLLLDDEVKRLYKAATENTK